MSHGLPDWYRGVDIAYQALSEMIVRPKYGGCQIASGNTVVTASDETDLVTVSGKGMIYGGMIYLDAAATQKNSVPRLHIDGAAIFGLSFLTQNDWGFDTQYLRPAFLQLYDNAAFKYATSFGYGITFETSVKLSFIESHGATPTVFYFLHYAVI
jgi:hypothetical protein